MSPAHDQVDYKAGMHGAAFVLALLLCLVAGFAAADDEEDLIRFPLKEVWRYLVDEYEATGNQRAILTAPLADDLRIYYASANGTCGALFKRTGEVSWIFHSSEPLTYGLLLIEAGPLVTASASGVFAIDRENGQILWQLPFEAGLSTSICGARDGLFICLQDGRIIKADPASGTAGWVHTSPAPVTSVPLVSGGLFFFGNAEGNVYCLNAADGSELWQFSAGGAVRSGFAVMEKRVFFGSDDNYFYAVDLDKGKLRWRMRTAGDVNGLPVCSGNTVYISASDRTLRAYRCSNGHARKGSPLQLTANIESPLLLSNGRILFARKKELVAIDAETIKETGKFAAPSDVTTAVLSDPASGALFFGCRSGELMATVPEVVAARQVSLQPLVPRAGETQRTAGVEIIPPETEPQAAEQEPAEQETAPAEQAEEPPAQAVIDEAAQEPEPPTQPPTEAIVDTAEEEPEVAVPEPEAVTPEPSPEEALELAPVATSEGDLERAARLWRTALARDAETTYTVSIGLFCKREAILELISRLSGREVMIFDRRRDDQTCFFVCLGRFSTREFAETYIETLDENLRRQNPAAYRLDSFIPPE